MALSLVHLWTLVVLMHVCFQLAARASEQTVRCICSIFSNAANQQCILSYAAIQVHCGGALGCHSNWMELQNTNTLQYHVHHHSKIVWVGPNGFGKVFYFYFFMFLNWTFIPVYVHIDKTLENLSLLCVNFSLCYWANHTKHKKYA